MDMSKLPRMSETPPPPQAVATDSRTGIRTSSLAIASLVMALVVFPCLLSLLPGADEASWIYGGMILCTALPVAAISRIRLSHGTRTGTVMACIAMFVALGWWGVWWGLSNFQRLLGPHWHG